MKPLIINTSNTDILKILFNKEKNCFIIKGNSFPEDATLFFAPVINWLKEYKEQANKNSVIVVALNYHNTVSIKQLLKAFFQFKKMSERGINILFQWYFEDIDSYNQGKECQELLDVPFEFVEKEYDIYGLF